MTFKIAGRDNVNTSEAAQFRTRIFNFTSHPTQEMIDFLLLKDPLQLRYLSDEYHTPKNCETAIIKNIDSFVYVKCPLKLLSLPKNM
jgi:hypothetical protein